MRGYFPRFFGRSGRCVRAEAATRRTGFGVFGSRSSLPAIEETHREVFSFLAIRITSFLCELVPLEIGWTH